jgi:hypothetical protein
MFCAVFGGSLAAGNLLGIFGTCHPDRRIEGSEVRRSGRDDFLNLKANLRIAIEVDGMRGSVTAHQANKERKGRVWLQLVAQAPFFEGYRNKLKRNIPILEPADEEPPVDSHSKLESEAHELLQ